MTKIKLCGLRRQCDIDAVNELKPDYVGFILDPVRRRYVEPQTVRTLRKGLDPSIKVVGVFVDEAVERVAELLRDGTIDIAQLHGHEDDKYIRTLKKLTDKIIIKAVRVVSIDDIDVANALSSDYVLLDSGQGGGKVFDWNLLKFVSREYFLAGGLDTENVSEAVKKCRPFAVDVSSGIETDGFKDPEKMKRFVESVRNGEVK